MNAAPQRRRLPYRRPSETISVECAGMQYTATISRFADGRLALCDDSGKTSGTLGVALDQIDAAAANQGKVV
jgi:hypothetical protein